MARSKVWKDGLYLGDWVTPAGEVLRCHKPEMRHFHDRMKAMLAKNSPIPWGLEHDEAVGLSAAERIREWAKHIKGHIHDVRIRPDDVTEYLIDVDDADRPLLESVKFCSPQIHVNHRDRHGPAKDDIGPYWPGASIAYLAATAVPVQFPQSPFEFGNPVSLSQVAVTVSLSSATLKPLSLSSMPFPPKKKPEEEAPPKPGDEAAAPPEEEVPESPELEDIQDEETPVPIADDAQDDPAGDTALIHTLGQIIAPLGIEVHVTPGMTLRDYVAHLCTAGKTHCATKDLAEAEEEPEPNEQQQQQDQSGQNLPEIAETTPIMLSQQFLTAENAKLKKQLAGATKNHKAALHAEIKGLHAGGYITAAHGNRMIAELKTISLSLADDGSVAVNAVTAELNVLKRLIADGTLEPKFNVQGRGVVSLSQADEGEVAESVPDGRQQADTGPDPELAAICGVEPSKLK